MKKRLKILCGFMAIAALSSAACLEPLPTREDPSDTPATIDPLTSEFEKAFHVCMTPEEYPLENTENVNESSLRDAVLQDAIEDGTAEDPYVSDFIEASLATVELEILKLNGNVQTLAQISFAAALQTVNNTPLDDINRISVIGHLNEDSPLAKELGESVDDDLVVPVSFIYHHEENAIFPAGYSCLNTNNPDLLQQKVIGFSLNHLEANGEFIDQKTVFLAARGGVPGRP